MTISNAVTAALHDLLARRYEDYERRANQMNKQDSDDLATLVNMAFLEAVQRRFLKDDKPASDAEVIDYVASTRAAHEESADDINPEAAEININYALGKLPAEAMDRIDNNVGFSTNLMLLMALTEEAGYDEEQLTEFIRTARAYAEEIRS